MREAELHDGRILEFPDGTPDEVIQSTVQRVLGGGQDQPQQPQPTAPQAAPQQAAPQQSGMAAAGEAGFKDMLDTALGVPDMLAATVLNTPNPMSFIGPMLGGDINQTNQGGTLLEDVTGIKPPAPGKRFLPIPSAEQLVAGGDVLTEKLGISPRQDSPGEDTSITGRFQSSLDRQKARAEASPNATITGQAIGTGLALMVGRLPGVKAMNKLNIARDAQTAGKASKLLPDPSKLGTVLPFTQRVTAQVNKGLRSPLVTRVNKALGRGLESGAEGLILETLNGGDQLEVASVAAGTQLAGSAGIGAIKAVAGSKTKVITSALGMLVTARLAQEFIPGAPSVGGAIDFAFDKIQYGIVLGLSGVALGATRGRGGTGIAKNLPEIVESMSAIHRGSLISLYEAWRIDPRVEQVANALENKPETFSPAERSKLERAITGGKISENLDQMFKVRSFRRKFDGPNQLDRVR